MKKLTIILLAALLLAFGLSPVTTASASTAVSEVQTSSGYFKLTKAMAKKANMTDVTHAGDDSGYTAPIHIVCTSGIHRYLYRGDSSFLSTTTSCGGNGVQRIVVELNQTVYCKNLIPPYQDKYYYSLYYNEVPSFASLKCYMQRPL